MRRCAQCILPETFPGITFDSDFVCNHCRASAEATTQSPLYTAKSLEDLISGYRRPGKEPECIVGLSGGRDSTFAAYYAARVLNLRVLLCTVDNGLMPRQTMLNIEKTREMLDADLVVVKNEQMKVSARGAITSWLRKPSIGMVPTFCVGCIGAIKSRLLQKAREHGISLVITGAGEPQLPLGNYLLSIPRGSDRKIALLSGYAMELARNPYYLLNPGCLIEMAREAYFRFLRPRIRRLYRTRVRFISAYKFVAWDESLIVSTIQNELGWENPYGGSTWKSDCKMHIVKQYAYRESLGFTKNDIILSCLIQQGNISRTEALETVRHENELPRHALIEALDTLGIEPGHFEAAVEKLATRHRAAYMRQ